MSIGSDQPDPLAVFERGHWRVPVGTIVYLKVSLGDHWNGSSVTVKPGTSGRIVDVTKDPWGESVHLEMIDSIGQPTGIVRLAEFFDLYQTTPILEPSRLRSIRDNLFPFDEP